jgi:16S rRNA (cytidine1402-2'-O)-methyltransferase
MEIKPGCLYIVGTPIGNLGDITARAVHVLKNVDFIAAEDTRVTGNLLSKTGIKNKLISHREHNTIQKSGEIIERLLSGEACAVVTDAGMPCISDPGERLVRECYENKVPVYVVPGPCALTAALAASGLDCSRFNFEGFLSVTKKQRVNHLTSLRETTNTLIFYEAPHKLRATLSDLLAYFGDRKIAVCRELTKLYEEVLRGNISDIIAIYEQRNPKGEYVLVIEGAAKPEKLPRVNKYAQHSRV